MANERLRGGFRPLGTMLALLLGACAAQPGPAPRASADSDPSPAARAAAAHAGDPPWQRGENNDAVDKGLAFSVPAADVLADFHGDPGNSALVVYVAGNYYFARAPLAKAFGQAYPQYRGTHVRRTRRPKASQKQIQHFPRSSPGLLQARFQLAA